MEKKKAGTVRDDVRNAYGAVARGTSQNAVGEAASACCCGSASAISVLPQILGYSEENLEGTPRQADMGLGCGNPGAIASLKPGESVLDLGSGGGFDCFVAAREVGETGKVVGVDMTPEMVGLARKNAAAVNAKNIEFRLGEIENLPVPDNSFDVIMSNCVINLSLEKQRVFNEAFRVLKPGGRLAISDIVAVKPLPPEYRRNTALLCGCVGGTESVDSLRKMLAAAGFDRITIAAVEESHEFIEQWFPGQGVENYVRSAKIQAVKPSSGRTSAISLGVSR